MRLVKVLTRHYKSFNCDYVLKANVSAEETEWEMVDGVWFPFVSVPLEREITAIVGANESGKSHLLDAIEILVGDRESEKRAFCRYSPLLSVEQGERRYPDFAGLFEVVGSEQEEFAAAGIPEHQSRHFLLWRRGPSSWSAVDDRMSGHELDEAQTRIVESLLPSTVRLKTNVPLPDSVSIGALAGAAHAPSRKQRNRVLDLLRAAGSAEDATEAVQTLVAELTNAQPTANDSPSMLAAQRELGTMLLTRIARVEPSVFMELAEAVRDSHEGHANGLVQKINESLDRHLQLNRWWRQDPDFSLRVSLREHELVFVIHDRTGNDYSFGERSTGLRYFLSYLVQLRGHDPSADGEILLMDEPDAYLSASGQQDLLRVLEDYVRPDGVTTTNQVAYVTHSPFLINRNAADRIRVLDKGRDDEGTRVVKDATHNRYEPLRSSIGSFVAETAFIGGANLFVEGPSDQVYLAEMTSYLRARGRPDSSVLDLNEVTIVASGSASSVPYMLYLARGQDEVKPPCAVLLDSDEAGEKARKQIRRGGAYRKQLVADDHVTLIGDWAAAEQLEIATGVQVREIEDLVPLKVAVAAARGYAERFLGYPDDQVGRLTDELVTALIASSDGSLLAGLQSAFVETFDASLEKVGFAKQVIRVAHLTPAGRRADGVPALEGNFATLLSHLAGKVRAAVTEEANNRRDRRIDRTVKSFLRDYPESAVRDRANLALRDIETSAHESDRFEEIQAAVARIRRDFRIDKEPLRAVDNYEAFKAQFDGIRRVERIANEKDL